MDGIYQTMPIPDVNNNRKREPVNKKSWSPNDGPVQNKQGLKVFMFCFEPNTEIGINH